LNGKIEQLLAEAVKNFRDSVTIRIVMFSRRKLGPNFSSSEANTGITLLGDQRHREAATGGSRAAAGRDQKKSRFLAIHFLLTQKYDGRMFQTNVQSALF
jgi:hypothetical protein